VPPQRSTAPGAARSGAPARDPEQDATATHDADLLLVRLPNHLGDAVMALPALDWLARRGWRLHLAARPWASALFEAYPWPVVVLQGKRRAQVAALRAARPVRALLLTNSFSSALLFRLAGRRATGYATDLRRALLAHAVTVPAAWRGDMHMVEYYLSLAAALPVPPRGAAGEPAGAAGSAATPTRSGTAGGPDRDAAVMQGTPVAPPAPVALRLALSARARDGARALLAAAGVASPFVMLCPLAIGRHQGQVKAWPGFTALAEALGSAGWPVVACPGPGEDAAVRAVLPRAVVLPQTDVATFGALLAASRLVVANDSGSGHLAAAVGARLLTVFGATDPRKTRPWGPGLLRAGGSGGWPAPEVVLGGVTAALQER
jgi:heptosyltransferase-2